MVVKLDSFLKEDISSEIRLDINFKEETYKINNGVNHIGEGSLLYALSLRELHIPSSVCSIHKEAFIHATQLRSIKVSRNNNFYSSKGGVLYDKTLTKLIHYPVAKNIGRFKLPIGITTISSYAFGGTGKLLCLEIPSSVEEVEENSFLNTKIQTLKFYHSTPSQIKFKGDKTSIINLISNCKVFVPCQYVDIYKKHPVFKVARELVPFKVLF